MLSRRIQILIDEDRYSRLSAEAERSNLSVAAIIRGAIDRTYPADQDQRQAAFRRLMAAPPMAVPDPPQLKAELDDIRAGGL